jgi:diacylglycerol kinase (ATP)
MERQARLIVNPVARGLPRRSQLLAGAGWLRERGWSVELCLTSAPGAATELAADAAANGVDCVVAVGGDGTLNEALNGVAGTPTALALVPGGTANVWAREAGIPRDPQAALRLLAEGEHRRIDAGRVNGRYFLLMASAGLDSLVVASMTAPLKRRFGQLAYIGLAAAYLRSYRGVPAEITLDGERVEAAMLMLVAGNTRSYGGLIAITPHAHADDGLLDVCLYTGAGRRAFAGHLTRTAVGRHLSHPAVLCRRVQQIGLRTDLPLPVQADGEVVAQTPAMITVAPAAVTVIVPAGRRSPLWRSQPATAAGHAKANG